MLFRSFQGKAYECGVYTLYSIDNLEIKSWVSKIGLLKAELSGMESGPKYDSTGMVLDTVSWHENYKLLAINPDSVTMQSYLQQYINTPFVY